MIRSSDEIIASEQHFSDEALKRMMLFDVLVNNRDKSQYVVSEDFYLTTSFIEHYGNVIRNFKFEEEDFNKVYRVLADQVKSVAEVRDGFSNKTELEINDAKFLIILAMYVSTLHPKFNPEQPNYLLYGNTFVALANEIDHLLKSGTDEEIAAKFGYKSVEIFDKLKHNDYTKMQLGESGKFENYATRRVRGVGYELGIYPSAEDQRAGESELGIEIKYDMKSELYFNFYVELCERHNSNSQMVPSGLLKDDATLFWMIGTPRNHYIVRKDVLLKELTDMADVKAMKVWHEGKMFAKTNTSFGLLITEDRLQQIAIENDISAFMTNDYEKCLKDCFLNPANYDPNKLVKMREIALDTANGGPLQLDYGTESPASQERMVTEHGVATEHQHRFTRPLRKMGNKEYASIFRDQRLTYDKAAPLKTKDDCMKQVEAELSKFQQQLKREKIRPEPMRLSWN